MEGKFKLYNKNLLKRVGALGCAVIMSTTTFAACSNADTNNQMSVVSLTDDNLSKLSFEELMQYLEDGLKKETVTGVYDFLENFNGDLTDSLYLKGDEDKKFQINWDTAIAMLLAYNELSGSEMYQIFDDFELKTNDLYKLIKGYTTMSIPAYLRLTNNTGISNLIKDKETQEFYLKYENKLIEMNKARFKALETNAPQDMSTFSAQARAFNQMVRDDFLNDSGEVSFGSLSDSYASGTQACVVPIITAALEITRSTTSRFTDKEIEQLNLDGYCNTIEKIITENIDNLKTTQVRTTSTPNEPTTAESKEQEIIDIDINYSMIRKVAIKDLQEKKKYYISDALSTLAVYDFTQEMANTLSTQSVTYATTQAHKKSSSSTKKYTKRKDLEKDYPELASSAKKQEKAISDKYEKENKEASSKAQSEANSIASEKSAENESKADQEIKDKNTTAKVQDNNGNSYDDYTVSSGNNGNVVIDDDHTTTKENGDSSPNFDGPIYDEHGNIIANTARMNLLPNKVFVKSLNHN